MSEEWGCSVKSVPRFRCRKCASAEKPARIISLEVKYPNLLRWSWSFQHQLNSRTVLFVSGAFRLIRRCLYTVVCVLVLLAVHRQTLGFPKSYFFVCLAALCLDLSFYQWHRGYLRVRSRANPMHTSEELSSFTIENAMQDSSKGSIQHYNRKKQCCFAFI